MDLSTANQKPVNREYISYDLISCMYGATEEHVAIILKDGVTYFCKRVDKMDTKGMHGDFFLLPQY